MNELLVIGALSGHVRQTVTDALRDRPVAISFWPDPFAVPARERTRATAVIIDGPAADGAFVDSLIRLKAWVRVTRTAQSYATEYAALQRREIPARGALPGRSTNETAEYAVLLMLAVIRRMVPAEQALRTGDPGLIDGVTHVARSLSEERVGIIGLGRVGRRVADLVRAHGAVVAHNAVRAKGDCCADDDGRYGEHLSLPELLGSSTVVSLHLRDRSGTWRADRNFFESLRSGAVLINTAQGALVEDTALIDALTTGKVAAAGLDVFATEPLPLSSPLLTAPNLLLTPHVAGRTLQVGSRIWRDACDTLVAIAELPEKGGVSA